jgi:2-dehydropantoate 2-reductase
MRITQNMAGKVRVAVIGGGAVGCLFADAAQMSGCDVTLCVRTKIDRVLIETDGAVRASGVTIAAEPDAVEPVDWIFLATKTHDTPSVAPWLDRLIGPCCRIVLLQNGIDAVDEVRPLVGTTILIPTLLYISVEKVAPGHIVHHGGNLAEAPQGPDCASFAKLLSDSFIDVKPRSDFVTASWRKLLCNIAVNPLTALTMQRMDVLKEPGIADLARGLMREAAEVGRRAGAQVTDKDIEDIIAFCLLLEGGGTSMLYDRLAGNRLEYEHLTGVIVRLGRRYEVATPLNAAILALLRALDEALQSAPFTPESLIDTGQRTTPTN